MADFLTEDFNAAADTLIHNKLSTTGGITLKVYGNTAITDTVAQQPTVATDGAGMVHKIGTGTFGGFIWADTGSNKHTSEAQFVNTNGNISGTNNTMPVAGFVNGGTYVGLKAWTAGGSDYEMFYRVAGTSRRFTVGSSGYFNIAGNPNNAALYKIEKEGAIVRAYINGTLRGTWDIAAQAAADGVDASALIAATKSGLLVTDAASRITSWRVDTLGVAIASPTNPTSTTVDHDSVLFSATYAGTDALSFICRYSKDNFVTYTQVANLPTPSVEVGGLTPDTDYKCQWAVVVAAGTSAFTASSAAAHTLNYQILAPGQSLVMPKTRAVNKIRVVTSNAQKGAVLGAINISSLNGAANTGAVVSDHLDVAVIAANSTAGAPTLSVGGVAKTVTEIDTFVTSTGTWKLFFAEMTGTIAHYLLTHSINSDYIAVLHAETAFWTAGDIDAPVNCIVGWAGLTHTVSMRVSKGGAPRWWDNKEAVTPSPALLRAALAAAQTPYANRNRALKLPSCVALPEMSVMKDSWRGAYDPTSLGPNSAGTTPTSNSNYVGVTSAQGGDYISSRGWYHEACAEYFDAAERNQDALITNTTYWNRYVQITKYGMSHPNQGIWSATHHQFVDAQYPQQGHSTFETRTNTGSALFVPNAAGWGFDSAHLANQAWAHWVATEHPFAALALNQQLAFAVSDALQWQRSTFGAGNYAINTEQDRAYGNALRAAWKMGVALSKITSTNNRLLWTAAKVEKIRLDFLKGVKLKNYDTAQAATGNVSPAAHRKLLNLHFVRDAAEGMTYADGTVKAYMDATSNFEPVQYMMEPLWIYTKANYADAALLFAKFADYAKNKNFYLPGRALDWYTTARGSFMPIAAQGEASAYTDWPGYKTWLESIVEPDANYLSFENHYNVHSYLRWRAALEFAKDVAVKIGTTAASFDAAIAKWDLAASGTSPSTNSIGIRNLTAPAPNV